jgi:hypothetical protein
MTKQIDINKDGSKTQVSLVTGGAFTLALALALDAST